MIAREKFIVMKRNFRVDILPEFVTMFKNSKHVSCKVHLSIMLLSYEKGRSHSLIRNPVNKRRKVEESKDVVILEQDLEQENKLLNYEIDKMKEELKSFVDLKQRSTFWMISWLNFMIQELLIKTWI